MVVNEFEEHISYILEDNDALYSLGLKMIKRLNTDDSIPIVKVVYNNTPKILGSTEELKKLSDIYNELSQAELIKVLIKLIDSLNVINESEFLKITAVDINFNRLFFDVKTKTIKYIVLPVNHECDFHDGFNWSWQFRNTVLLLLNKIFNNIPERYNEIYSVISNMEFDYKSIISYIQNYDFNFNYMNTGKKNDSKKTDVTKMILEHMGKDGNIFFVINSPKFIIGKSRKTADGVIDNYDSISRNHCRICKKDDCFTVEDLDSTNGTMINGYKLNSYEKYYINNGDKLMLADLEFDVTIE